MLIPVGFAYFIIYYFLFSFAIRKLNLATPGRAEAAIEPFCRRYSRPLLEPQAWRVRRLLLPARSAM